jgi:hypothetical protein
MLWRRCDGHVSAQGRQLIVYYSEDGGARTITHDANPPCWLRTWNSMSYLRVHWMLASMKNQWTLLLLIRLTIG